MIHHSVRVCNGEWVDQVTQLSRVETCEVNTPRGGGSEFLKPFTKTRSFGQVVRANTFPRAPQQELPVHEEALRPHEDRQDEGQ